MSPYLPTMSALEGVRLVLALVGMVASLWAIAHVGDGSLAFAAPVRGRMKERRRIQMFGNLAIFAILGAQTFGAALVPDPPTISAAGYAVSYAMIAVVAILLAMTLMFSIGWSGVAEVLANTPLQPSVAETSLESRQLIHDMAGDLLVIVGEAEMLRMDPVLPPAQRDAATRIARAGDALGQRLVSVQRLARSLSPDAPTTAQVMEDTRTQPGDTFPRPDPTRLTSAALREATTALRDALQAEIKGLQREIEQLQIDIRTRPAEIARGIEHLDMLILERLKTVQVQFEGIQVQFRERDARGSAAELAATTAINAALQSQKEAAGESSKSFKESIDKSERGALERIKSLETLLTSTSTASLDKISGVEKRLERIEGAAVGVISAKTEVATTHTASSQNIGVIVGVVGVGIAVITLIDRFIK